MVGSALAIAACVEPLPGDERLDAGELALRPIRPRTGDTVYARRPLLRWGRPDETVGARVELCRDRACAEPILSADVSGSELRVPSDLPTGPVFWRVRPRLGGAVASWVSPTRWFIVARGARDTERAARSGRRPRLQIDVDGDARADVIAPDGTIYRSEGARFDAVPYGRLSVTGPLGARGAGDLNGDGYLDLFTVDPTLGGGSLAVYLGPLARGMVTPNRRVPNPRSGALVFPYLQSYRAPLAGDVNGDGYDDLIVESLVRADNTSRVDVFLGGASGISQTSAQSLENPMSRPALFSPTAVVDRDGDGFDDILIAGLLGVEPGGDFGLVARERALQVLRGAPSGLLAQPMWSFRAGGGRYGPAADLVDLDGDGATDIAASTTDDAANGCVALISGAADGDEPAAQRYCGESARFLGSALEAGDVDGDGRSDLIVSSELRSVVGNNVLMPDRYLVYRASRRSDAGWPAESIGPPPGVNLGLARMSLADVDADGVMDAVAWARTGPSVSTISVHRGGADGLTPTPERIGL